MEKWDARPLLRTAAPEECRNIVELESHRALHSRVQEVIQLVLESDLTTSEIQQHLHHNRDRFGKRFMNQLIRALYLNDENAREAVTWLLTLLNDQECVPQIQQIVHNPKASRAIRLSASLVLAGMGVTREVTATSRRLRMYAIS